MTCYFMMYSMVEFDQTVAGGIGEVSPRVLPMTGDRKDDVFAAPSEEEEFNDLSHKFELMQASESSDQSASEQVCKDMRGSHSVTLNTSNLKLPLTTSMEHAARYKVYTCQTTTSTIVHEAEASVKHIFSKLPVPKIVIDSVPYSDVRRAPECYCKHSEIHPRKILERHRQRDYFRPYCALSRRHYTSQPISIRRRRFGVSQRGNAEPGVNELTYLLENLGADGTTSGEQNRLKKEKSKPMYSPHPKYYMIRYKPSANLANIKEKSRSLSDLSIQSSRKVPSRQTTECNAGASSSTFCLPNTKGTDNFLPKDSSGAQMLQVMSGINNLNVSN